MDDALLPPGLLFSSSGVPHMIYHFWPQISGALDAAVTNGIKAEQKKILEKINHPSAPLLVSSLSDENLNRYGFFQINGGI